MNVENTKGCRDWELLLDEFVSGSSTDASRRRVEKHLAGCAGCRGVVRETQDLLQAAAGLSRERSPERDLWPGIRAEIDRQRQGTFSERPRRPVRSPTRWLALAASLAIVAIAGGATLWLRQSTPDPVVADSGSPGALLQAVHDPSATLDQELREYVEAAELLQASIRERVDSFSPETLAVLDKNLEIIDQAIREVRLVLESESAGGGDVQILQAMHQQKVELLRRVARLSS